MINPPDQKVYCGLDVSKKSLDAYMAGKYLRTDNNPYGHQRLARWIHQHSTFCHVVCEATGGYERNVVAILQTKNVPVSIVSPVRPRQLARSMGWFAKTDRKDAELLAFYGEKVPLKMTLPTPADQRELTELVSYHHQLQDKIVSLTNQLEHLQNLFVKKSTQRLMKTLKKEFEKIEAKIREHIQQNDELKTKKEKLMRFQGVGEITAHALLAYLPELGTLSRCQVAALVGVAPYNRDSGERQGYGSISGGRPNVRASLYMAALTASQKNPVLSTFYQRLIQNGKPPKVALTAVMRKLIIAINSSLKNSNFTLAN